MCHWSDEATDNFTPTDPGIRPQVRQQARKASVRWAIPARHSARFVRQSKVVNFLARLSALSLWVLCGSVIAAVLVCRNDAALVPLAFIVIGSILAFASFSYLHTLAWMKLQRIGEGRE